MTTHTQHTHRRARATGRHHTRTDNDTFARCSLWASSRGEVHYQQWLKPRLKLARTPHIERRARPSGGSPFFSLFIRLTG